MNFNKIFQGENILKITELSPGYEDHSSNVWSVKTDRQEVIVRSSKVTNVDKSIFWGSCNRVFGINPMNVSDVEAVNNVLCNINGIKTPKIIGKGIDEEEYIIVEKINGTMINTFENQDYKMLYSLGAGLAKIHQYRLNYIGSPTRKTDIPLNQWKDHLKTSLDILVNRYYKADTKILNRLPKIIEKVSQIDELQYTTFVLVDLDSTQFLTDGEEVTAVVDTEAYVIAPRELDFIALEYVLNHENVKAFIEGYRSIMEIPNLSKCREVYRYLYRLIEVQGNEDLDDWFNYPKLF